MDGIDNFLAPPRPEMVLALFGAPPVMLFPTELVPAPPEFASALAVEFDFASGEPPGTPAAFPSGEIATRAARFPAGGATGADGPGVAESAISAWPEPLGEVSCAASSGTGSFVAF